VNGAKSRIYKICFFFQDADQTLQTTEADDTPTEVCIICKARGTDPLKAFKDQIWCTFKRAAEMRLSKQSDCHRDTTLEVNLRQEAGNAMYHSRCYRNYTAVKRPASTSQSEPPSKKPETRRRSGLAPSNERGLLKGTCIFCPVVRKTVNRKVEPLSDCLTKDGCDAIFEAAPRSSNTRIKALVAEGVDLIAKEAQYHKSCRREYFKEAEGAEIKNTEISSRQLHSQTFRTLSDLVQKEVIDNRRAMLSTSVLELYKTEYLEAGGVADDIESYTVQALMKKIKDKFMDRISISNYDHRKGNFLHCSDMSNADARASLHDADDKHIHEIRTAALHLRAVIQAMPKWSTPTPTSVETLKACSSDLPEEILLFFRTLLCGLREPSGIDNREAVDRKVNAMSSDAVYNASNGSVRPWKHTVIGLGLGTLTGSKLILRILNRLGYSLSYDEVKSLETEFAFSVEANNQDAPDGVEMNPNLGTGLAWDNYDVNMETLDGKDTLHATVGICYQNMTRSAKDGPPISGSCSRKRRQFDGDERDIAPYYKQIKKAKFDLSGPACSGDQEAPALRQIDFYWLLLSEVEKPIPLFQGFYSQFMQDNLPLQKVWYMDPLSAPPTRNDVVRETMTRTMRVAMETGQEYGIVTYDLAVALKAYSIQALDAPHFDKLLIMLGNFHLELAFYGAIGTFINESGIEHLLTESGILAEGSLMGFIRGKLYNRCARVHEILAQVMERKLYESFLSSLSRESQKSISELLADVPNSFHDKEQFLQSQPLFKEHLDQYEEYFKRVMEGELGPTAQYWCMYIYMINRVHRDLLRAVLTNDVDDYIKILPAIIDIFFGLNRPNYARWGVLLTESKRILQAGAFSIRRTNKQYSRSAIDLTLEQTVNRDAASPMRGIVGFHYSHNAIRRWCITSTQRGMAVTELRNMTGLETEEQPAAQLRASRINKDSHQRDVLFNTVTESCDPFSTQVSNCPSLLNLATGKAAAHVTQKYLTGTLAAGHELHMKFREECAIDSGRLMKPIKRRPVANFAKENAKKKTGNTKGKPAEGLRDVFIRILVAISEKTNFNLRHVMKFPIVEYPLSITHPDGSGLKTKKDKLLEKLEELQEGFITRPLPPIDVTLIDGGLLIHSFLSAIGNISTYGNLARSLLASVCGHRGNEIHVLFDTYCPTSLKSSERKLRGAEDHPFLITGPQQSPRQSCQKLLQNGLFKEQLAVFLLKEWQEDHYGPILGKKTLVLSHGGNCVSLKFDEQESKMNIEQPAHLQGNHEEADTLIAFHLSSANGNVMIRASDTDVLVIVIGMVGRQLTSQRATSYNQIIMDCGSGNTRRHIDLSSITTVLESKQKGLAAALPGLHAFTGCDYTTAFYRKGKTKPLQVLEGDTEGTLVKFFTSLATKDQPIQEKAEEFICTLYGMKGDVKDVNEARYQMLCQMTGNMNQVLA